MIMNYPPTVTLDVDWAPDFMIDYVSDLLTEQNIHATWFITHDSPSIQKLSENELFEIGLHPNFEKNSTQGKDPHSILKNLLSIAPDSKSVRTHRLFQSTPILKILPEYGIQNECTLLLEHNYNLQPFFSKHLNLYRFPYFWEDDVTMSYPFNWNECEFENSSSLQIFNFHPIHIYLNSKTMENYEKLKTEVKMENLNPQNTEQFINLLSDGTQTFFKNLLSQLSKNKTCTISDLQNIFKCEKNE